MVVVLAEPAVYVLTEQVEEVTAGGTSKKTIMLVLSVGGIACAVSLSMVRILCAGLKLWHFLLPGFALAAFFCLIEYRQSSWVSLMIRAGGWPQGP